MTATASVLFHAGAAAVCLGWTALIAIAGRGGRGAALLPAAACGAAALWAGAVALTPDMPLAGAAGALEVVRDLIWFGLLLALCRRIGTAPLLVRRFAVAGGIAAVLALASLLPTAAGAALVLPTLGSPSLLARLGLALLLVLLAENLYRNADEASRWLVNLPCIALGGLGAFDLLLYADAALSREFSPALLDARAALTALVMPLLAIAAMRGRRSRRDPPVSREAVFHGATLVIAGAFLLGVGVAGEALRRLAAEWGAAAQAGLLAGAVMALAVAGASGSVRSRVRRLVVDHFFIARYDYRREWLRCVAALSAGDDGAPAATRAIRALADPVDSPAGVMLLREPGGACLRWAGSWNRPAGPLVLPDGHPLLGALRGGDWVAVFDAQGGSGSGAASAPPADLDAACGPLWLAVPLARHREDVLGVVLLAPPRAPFKLDREVFDLLRSIGREVAMFLAERRAAERLADQRRLQDYAKRFAFVAHDVKTVASQLRLLLANAEENLHDPEFQRDMLLTVRTSADRIDTLIARLRQPEAGAEDAAVPPASPLPPAQHSGALPRSVVPVERLLSIVRARRAHRVQVEADVPPGLAAAIAPDRFDAAVTHLLDNAIDASGPGEPVRVRVRQDAANPASVTTTSARRRPSRVATTLLQPCAMLAKGPPWISAGEPSSDCTRLGAKASRSSAAIAPAALRSPAVTAEPSRRCPTMIRPSRACSSARSRARQKIAITSEATVMSNPSSRG